MTTAPTADDAVSNHLDAHRYEIRSGGELAGFVTYQPGAGDDGVVTFEHTEIDDRFEGQGLGGRLARAALDDVRARDQRVVPRCPFIARWIERHADYGDLVAS